jgi:hypothetical protein
MQKWYLAGLGTLGAAFFFALGFGARTLDRSPALPADCQPLRKLGGNASPQLTGLTAETYEILLNPDVLERTAALAELLQGLGPEALGEIRSGFDNAFIERGEIDLVLLAEWWARFDPEGALRWTGADFRADNARVKAAVYRAWARRDPGALPAAEADKGPLWEASLIGALEGWEESGRPGLLEYVEAMPAGPARRTALGVVARRKVMRDGPEEAFRWVADVAGPADSPAGLSLRRELGHRVVGAAAEIDPEAAARWVETRVEGPDGAALTRRLVARWVRRDPEAALAWLEALPEVRAQAEGVNWAFLRWLHLDRDGALAWLQATGAAPWLDRALANAAQVRAAEDPTAALEQAGQIADAELRDATRARVARVWFLNEPEAARAWVESSDLPELLKPKIFQIPPAMRPRPRRQAGTEGEAGQPPGGEANLDR